MTFVEPLIQDEVRTRDYRAAVTRPVRRPAAAALIAAARPRQWLKNALVVAAPAAAGAVGRSPVIGHVALGFAAFCLVSSGTYLLNDIRDAEADRAHPDKWRRPVAAGELSPRLAAVAAAMAFAVGLAAGAAAGSRFLIVLAGYAALTSAYSFGLKQLPVVDLLAITACFLLRAVGGGAAAGVAISGWFLAVVSFAALFVVAGKRYAEHTRLGSGRGSVRATLDTYSPGFLRMLWRRAAMLTIAAYVLWALGHPGFRLGIPWGALSVVPLALAVRRYSALLERGHGDCPEAVVLTDAGIRALGLAWVVVFAIATYGG